MPAARPTVRGIALALLLGVLASGCGGEDPAPAPQSPATADASTSPTQSATSPTEPTDVPTSDEPTVEPATGILLREEISQLNAPEGDWKRIPDIVTFASAVGNRSTAEVISLSDMENFATVLSLDEQVKAHKRTLPEGAIVRRQENVMLDGALAYYVQWWTKGDTKIQHDIGIDQRGRVIGIQMDLDRADPAAAEALVAAVLASFRWR